MVDWALERGFYVDLDVHHDSWEWANLSTETDAEKQQKLDKLSKLWAQIADRFKNSSQRFMFETINEPPGNSQADEYNLMNKQHHQLG